MSFWAYIECHFLCEPFFSWFTWSKLVYSLVFPEHFLGVSYVFNNLTISQIQPEKMLHWLSRSLLGPLWLSSPTSQEKTMTSLVWMTFTTDQSLSIAGMHFILLYILPTELLLGRQQVINRLLWTLTVSVDFLPTLFPFIFMITSKKGKKRIEILMKTGNWLRVVNDVVWPSKGLKKI